MTIKNILNNLFKSSSNEVLGLDIGTLAIKGICLDQSGGHYTITGGAKVDISQETPSRRVEQMARSIEAICRCVSVCGYKSNRVVCAVDAPDAAVRGFTLPPMPPGEIGYAVLQEAEHVSPSEMENTVVDYQLVGDYREGQEIRGMLAAASTDAIGVKCQLAVKAALKAVLVDTDTMALINCFSVFGNLSDNQTTAIIYVTNSCTNFIILSAYCLPFIRNISCRGGKILSAISSDLGLSEQEVMLSLFGQDYLSTGFNAVRDSFFNTIGSLVSEIGETIRYYQTYERDSQIDRILLCGDFTMIEGVEQFFDNSLAEPVERWNPVDNIEIAPSVKNRDLLYQNGPGMAVALGLSMRTF